jgi:hypothetical protein
MKNGSRLIGELIRIEADKVTFSTPFAGTITANQDKVERIITQAAVTLLPKSISVNITIMKAYRPLPLTAVLATLFSGGTSLM